MYTKSSLPAACISVVSGIALFALPFAANASIFFPISTNNDTNITSFDIGATVGSVDNTADTVDITVPSGTDLTDLTPTIVLEGQGASISPNSGDSGDFSSPVTYTVTASDGTTQNYTVTVTVQTPLSSDDVLSALTVDQGSLSPSFDPDTLSYTDDVSNGITSVNVTATTEDANATITVNGVAASSSNAYDVTGLAVGENAITVAVTAQDGVTSQTYTIDVDQAAPPVPAPAPSSGGGGGGGGFADGVNGPPVATSTSEIASSSAGEVLGANAYNFATNFGVGAVGEDVTQLQAVLIADGYLAIPTPTGTFGPKTKAAVEAFQSANGITPVSGYVGPKTRAVLNAGTNPTSSDELQSLQKELQALEAQIAALITSATSASTTSTN